MNTPKNIPPFPPADTETPSRTTLDPSILDKSLILILPDGWIRNYELEKSDPSFANCHIYTPERPPTEGLFYPNLTVTAEQTDSTQSLTSIAQELLNLPDKELPDYIPQPKEAVQSENTIAVSTGGCYTLKNPALGETQIFIRVRDIIHLNDDYTKTIITLTAQYDLYDDATHAAINEIWDDTYYHPLTSSLENGNAE